MSQNILTQITTYILSSSIDPKDLKKAAADPLIKGFLSKPPSPHLEHILYDTIASLQI